MAYGEPFEPADVAFTSVSPRLATARRIAGCTPLLLIAAAFAALALPGEQQWAWGPAVAFAAVAIWTAWLIGRQVPAIGYAERDDELLVRTGIMYRRIVVVPYGRLQFVDVQAGPLDRMLGISRVQLHTASAASDASIPGLAPEEAARLRDRLTARGQSNLAGL
jgi:membrane protein YdbS with pleckstrin-like domain